MTPNGSNPMAIVRATCIVSRSTSLSDPSRQTTRARLPESRRMCPRHGWQRFEARLRAADRVDSAMKRVMFLLGAAIVIAPLVDAQTTYKFSGVVSAAGGPVAGVGIDVRTAGGPA